MIWLFLDSYHDRRTGFEFGVNPSGVKLDAQIYNDGNEDFAWDAVWDVATRVTRSAGRPNSASRCHSCRTAGNAAITFGFTVDRDLYRYSQRVSWPSSGSHRRGLVSQFGEINGLEESRGAAAFEAAPYLVTKKRVSDQQHTLGAPRT